MFGAGLRVPIAANYKAQIGMYDFSSAAGFLDLVEVGALHFAAADERRFPCLRLAREDRVFRVPNPKLTDEQIEALKGQLSEILDFQV